MSREEEITLKSTHAENTLVFAFLYLDLGFICADIVTKCVNWVEIVANRAIVEAKLTSPNEEVIIGQRE